MRPLFLTRLMLVIVVLVVGAIGTARAHAQAPGTGTPPAAGTAAPAAAPAPTSTTGTNSLPEGSRVTLKELFLKSFDMFTVLLVIGSLAGWTIIIIAVIEIRKANICPDEPEQIISQLVSGGRWPDLRAFVAEDDAFVSKVVRAGLDAPGNDMDSVRESAELAASEESSRWFRKIEPLNVIGNLGPLLGLAGTVWGMIIAFAALGESGGQANPATLSIGIAKALFHTLLGLLLAVPCLVVFGFYRSLVDKLCTHAMVRSADLVELLPPDARTRGAAGGAAGATGNGQPRSGQPAPAQRLVAPSAQR